MGKVIFVVVVVAFIVAAVKWTKSGASADGAASSASSASNKRTSGTAGVDMMEIEKSPGWYLKLPDVCEGGVHVRIAHYVDGKEEWVPEVLLTIGARQAYYKEPSQARLDNYIPREVRQNARVMIGRGKCWPLEREFKRRAGSQQ